MTDWTLPRDVATRATAVWDRGAPLKAVAAGEEFSPLRMPIKGPAVAERGARYDDLRAWLDAWRAAQAPIRVQWRSIRDRVLGRIHLPAAAYLDTVDDVARLAGKTKQLEWFRQAVLTTPDRFRPFMAARPHRVLRIGAEWPAVVAAAGWLADNPGSGLHPRQIPVDGVHTKVVERYRRDIAAMTPDQTGRTSSGQDWFAARYGLAVKPQRVRMRFLDPALPGRPVYSDIEVPTAEAARHPVQAERVLVVENEIPFLALPPIRSTVAVLGNGNAAPSLLAAIPWVAQTPIAYWGDIDTWGLVILDRVRATVAERAPIASVLMDHDTLLDHRDAWVQEETPTATAVPHLTEPERALYTDLLQGRLGHRVRLEQERLPIQALLCALEHN